MRWFTATVLLVTLVLGAACGDDDDGDAGGTDDNSSPETYLLAWKTIREDVNGRINQNSEDYPGGFNGDLEETKTSFVIYLDLFDEYIDRVGALDVPEELQALHDENLAANQGVATANHERGDLLAEATTYSEVDQIFGPDEEFSTAVARIVDSCLAYEAKSRDYGLDFALGCER
jgi:hypothetical protein